MYPSSFQLRDYQVENLKNIRELWLGGENRQLNVLATGLGKTVIFSHIKDYLPEIAHYGVLVLVHRDELIEQTIEKFQLANPSLVIGVEKANTSASINADIIVASVQTVGRGKATRLNRFQHRIGIIIVDECHHVSRGSTYAKVLNRFGVGDKVEDVPPLPCGNRRLSLGFTATPNRTDGAGLDKFYSSVAFEYDIRSGIDNGYLVDIICDFAKTDTDITDIKTVAGDFAKGDLGRAVDNDSRNNRIISAYNQFIDQYNVNSKKAIAFCASVDHAHHLAYEFTMQGIPAVAIDGTTDKDVRRSFVDNFKHGPIKVLCNYGVFTEGFDAPSVGILIMARPTQSDNLYAQMMGRGTRPVVSVNYPTKEQRREAIASSEKPFILVIDVIDIAKRKLKLASPTKLAGISSEFKSEGKKLFTEVIPKVEEYEEAHPDLPIRDASSFSEIDIIAERVDIWLERIESIAKKSEEIRSMSKFNWTKIRDDKYEIEIRDDRPLRISVVQDSIGRWWVERQQVPKYNERNKKWIIYPKHRGKSPFETLEHAIAACDQRIVTKFGHVSYLMEHSPTWGKGHATEGQIKFLQVLGLNIPDGTEITKARAHQLINDLKAAKRHGPRTRKSLEKERSSRTDQSRTS